MTGNAIGYAFNLGDGEQVGMAASHSNSKLQMNGVQQSGQTEEIGWGAYASKKMDGFVADAAMGITNTTISTARGVGLVGGVASGTTRAQLAGFETGLAYPFKAEGWAVRPHMDFGYMRAHQDAYSETGAGLANLQIDAINMTMMRGAMGVDVSNRTTLWDDQELVSQISLGWEHQFMDVTPVVRERFAAQPQASFTLVGEDQSRDAFLLGAALKTGLAPGVALMARGDLSATAQQTDEVMRIGLQVSF